MTIRSKLVLLREQPVEFTNKVFNRLGFFPFTLLQVLFNAAVEAFLMKRRRAPVRLAAVAGTGRGLASHVMMWLRSGTIDGPLDLCLQLPRDAVDATLHDVFSVMLTRPHLRMIGLYWDSSGLDDDFPLLGLKQDPGIRGRHVNRNEPLGSPTFREFEEFLRSDHEGIALPVAATRDAQTLLKRQAEGMNVVCLNVPRQLNELAEAVARARPDVHFFDFVGAFPSGVATTNWHSVFGYGLSLHERMAIVQAADLYIGGFDELGCTALASGRPALLLGNDGECGEPVRAARALWFRGPVKLDAMTKAALEFLSSHLAPGQEPAAAMRDDAPSSREK